MTHINHYFTTHFISRHVGTTYRIFKHVFGTTQVSHTAKQRKHGKENYLRIRITIPVQTFVDLSKVRKQQPM